MGHDATSSKAPDGVSEGAQPDLRGPAWVGTRVEAGAPIPVAGTWEIVDHPDCPANGELRAFGQQDMAPECSHCGRSVTWQLSHLAVTVAADHPDPDTLP